MCELKGATFVTQLVKSLGDRKATNPTAWVHVLHKYTRVPLHTFRCKATNYTGAAAHVFALGCTPFYVIDVPSCTRNQNLCASAGGQLYIQLQIQIYACFVDVPSTLFSHAAAPQGVQLHQPICTHACTCLCSERRGFICKSTESGRHVYTRPFGSPPHFIQHCAPRCKNPMQTRIFLLRKQLWK
jgi:hypothetical protein